MRETWKDHLGRLWTEPFTSGPLRPYCVPSHTALRAFVFQRDSFRCGDCSATALAETGNYDGRATLATDNGSFLVMDHVVSRRNGGRHHPSNLRTLCDRCNARKSSLVDSKGVA